MPVKAQRQGAWHAHGGLPSCPQKRIIILRGCIANFPGYAVAGNVITSACFVATGVKLTRCA
jgi:hypothetical protein